MKKSFAAILFVILTGSCSKYLDEKPDKKLNTVNSLEDCQAILDRNLYINKLGVGVLEAASDNYYFNEDFWNNLLEEDKNLYTWQPANIFPRYAYSGNDWSHCYDNVFRANFVLESVEKFTSNQDTYRDVKGQAYFIRANNFLLAAWTWSLAFDKSAPARLGIPLRLHTNFNETTTRSTLEETYRQILSDIKNAIDLLPVTAKHVYRPSRPAAYALLARAYLSMNEYDSCYKYAQRSWELKSDLLNYNKPEEVAPLADIPFKNFNKEILYEFGVNHSLTYKEYSFIDTSLVHSFADFDIRKSAFFTAQGKHFKFKGSYNDDTNFGGITTAEVLLMKAESAARLGQINIALSDLNLLRKNRLFDTAYFPLVITDKGILIDSVLQERRRELVMRGLRFMDIKRLNLLGANISVKRFMNGKEYTLPANDLRFALAIPEDIIEKTGIAQNPR